MSTRIKIVNKSEYDTPTVRRLIRMVARDAEVSDVCVTVKHRKDGYTSGRYREWWYIGKEDRAQITISLPLPGVPIADYHPYQRTRTEQGRHFPLNDWQEALVAVAAHELHHHRQAGRTARSRGRFVEVECDLAAYRAVARMKR